MYNSNNNRCNTVAVKIGAEKVPAGTRSVAEYIDNPQRRLDLIRGTNGLDEDSEKSTDSDKV